MSEQDSNKTKPLSRRDFLKLLGAGGTALAFAPFVPWGNFMPNPSSASTEKAKVILPDGTHANVNTFPVNHAEIITYPKTKDEVLNEEAFRKWQLIRLPEELGGAAKDTSAFRAFSMICLHLWCLWKYWPEEGRKRGECPCHGSMYDPNTGTAFVGPASLQAPPSNTLPKLDLEADADGFMYISPVTWGVNDNGVVGYGRFVKK
jgi:rieske iron-sulfur protein